MKLFARNFGGRGRPIVILHGLFGSSKNWNQVGRLLAGLGEVHALDQRNHGASPHHPSHTLQDLVSDLDEWLRASNMSDVILLGHSMGGLAAMGFSLRHPERVSALVVVDIAPRAYHHTHEPAFRAMNIDISGLKTRTEVDRAMAGEIPDRKTRQFLQMNLNRTTTGFTWAINLPALESSTVLADADSLSGRCTVSTLFVAGGSSAYIQFGDHKRIRSLFPRCRIEEIPEADHWMHYSATEEFVAVVSAFLRPQDSTPGQLP